MEKYIETNPEDYGTDRDPSHVLFVRLEKRRAYAKANSISIRLQRHLNANGLDVEKPVRLYGGALKASGAWMWCAKFKGSMLEIGSGASMKTCLKASSDELTHLID